MLNTEESQTLDVTATWTSTYNTYMLATKRVKESFDAVPCAILPEEEAKTFPPVVVPYEEEPEAKSSQMMMPLLKTLDVVVVPEKQQPDTVPRTTETNEASSLLVVQRTKSTAPAPAPSVLLPEKGKVASSPIQRAAAANSRRRWIIPENKATSPVMVALRRRMIIPETSNRISPVMKYFGSTPNHKPITQKQQLDTPTTPMSSNSMAPSRTRTKTFPNRMMKYFKAAREEGSPYSLKDDDDSMMSCLAYSVPNYTRPTVSAKAKARPLSVQPLMARISPCFRCL
ncbi:uncharacterized protein [Rutidosis leptorrhynchoides]|uniref:uncharacterized protein isoform X1 n=1 Tax=Rutidosis leptorrhynchoides TaxID=125765 RepID=UPI003A99B245